MRRAVQLALLLSVVLADGPRFTAHAQAPYQGPGSAPQNSVAYFTDVAQKAGLTMMNVFGGKDTKRYIIETTGAGVAIFDYDNDGWPDIFIVNGTTLEGFPQ